MALSESLNIDRLEELFDNDWNELYKPLTIENTVLNDIMTSDTLRTINNLVEKTEENSQKINHVERIMSEQKTEMDIIISDVSTRVQRLEKEQNEVENFLSDILNWKTQDGSVL